MKKNQKNYNFAFKEIILNKPVTLNRHGRKQSIFKNILFVRQTRTSGYHCDTYGIDIHNTYGTRTFGTQII